MSAQPKPDTLAAFKRRLQEAREALIELHQAQTDVETVVRRTASYVDEILLSAWQHFFGDREEITMVAVGGYGRGELNIHSDIDLLFLHAFSAPADEALERSGVGGFIQFLWDIGLEVGQSVRTVEESLDHANHDITIMTNLLECRFLAGDRRLYDRFEDQLRNHSDWTNSSFYDAKYEEQVNRHERFDETTYKLEPNIKKSPGGLRDIQTISWIANKIYGTSDPDSLSSRGLLTADELALFKESRNKLWLLRNALHIQTGRAEDRLLFAHQQEIARSFGLEDKPGLLAIEQLMQQYYRAAQNIRRLNEFILQLIEESLDDAQQAPRIDLDDNFYIQNSYLGLSRTQAFVNDPSQILQVFNLYQRHHYALKGFSADCARALREARHLIDDAYREDKKNLDLFLSLFKRGTGLTHTLRKMHQMGVLGVFMPVFGKIEGQMQHDLFHAYTVDAHTLMVIRNLRRLAVDRFRHEMPAMTDLMLGTKKHYRLYLAAIFHDIAKGRGGSHDKLGAIDAHEYCEKLGLSKKDVRLISWLVLNHLNMSMISQREDLSDPEVIERFADLVEKQTYLDNLYLLTVADIRGTSASTWTAWKGHLLAQLYSATTAELNRRKGDKSGSSEALDPNQRFEAQKNRIHALLENRIPTGPLEQFWAMLDEDYFLMYSPDTIACHAEAICTASALDLPIVDIRYMKEAEAEQYLVYTADSDILLSTVTSVIEQLGQNIVQARIHAANPGFTVLIFTVTGDDGAPDRETLTRHTELMRSALLQAREHRAPIKKLVPRRLQQFSIPPSVEFSDTPDKQLTVASITALDQPGLIHQIATVIAGCRIRLVSAHITTTGEKAEDRFTLSQYHTQKALNERQKSCMREALMDLLESE